MILVISIYTILNNETEEYRHLNFLFSASGLFYCAYKLKRARDAPITIDNMKEKLKEHSRTLLVVLAIFTTYSILMMIEIGRFRYEHFGFGLTAIAGITCLLAFCLMAPRGLCSVEECMIESYSVFSGDLSTTYVLIFPGRPDLKKMRYDEQKKGVSFSADKIYYCLLYEAFPDPVVNFNVTSKFDLFYVPSTPRNKKMESDLFFAVEICLVLTLFMLVKLHTE